MTETATPEEKKRERRRERERERDGKGYAHTIKSVSISVSDQYQLTSYREGEYFTSHHPNNRPIRRNINTSCAGGRELEIKCMSALDRDKLTKSKVMHVHVTHVYTRIGVMVIHWDQCKQ